MKLIKNWKWYELIMLFASWIILTCCFAFSPDRNWLSFVNSLIGVFAVLCVAKGLVYAPIINIIFLGVYAALCITEHFWGEVIICFCLTLPVCISSIVSWFKNRSNENKGIVKINKVTGKEYLFLFIGVVVLTFAAYFLLKALKTSELIISTFSIVTSLSASYLLLRRSPFYAVGYILNDIVLITLWSVTVINFGLGNLPTLVSYCIFFFHDAYGFIRWIKEFKRKPKIEETQSEIENNK